MYASLSLRAHLPTSRHYQSTEPQGPICLSGGNVVNGSNTDSRQLPGKSSTAHDEPATYSERSCQSVIAIGVTTCPLFDVVGDYCSVGLWVCECIPTPREMQIPSCRIFSCVSDHRSTISDKTGSIPRSASDPKWISCQPYRCDHMSTFRRQNKGARLP